ncbi:MAG: hypothetical protein E7412_02610 [Ruminococcaceae bacterium]|nr:hypothetical protein [Oscillospiraceae bacterium]
MKGIYEKGKKVFLNNRNGIITFLYALLNAALIYYCLELGNKNPFFNGIFYTGINILTIFAVMAAVFFFVQRWWISSLVVSIPVLFLSIANYYTLLYRNSPISTQDLHNVGTTLSVLGGYKFPLSFFVVAVIVVFVLSLAVTRQLYVHEKGKKFSLKKVLVQNLCIAVLCTLFMHSVYFAKEPIKPRNTFVWSWEASYHSYGFVASSIEVFQNSVNMVNRPENYSEDTLSEDVMMLSKKDEKDARPDIIFILNETFYDLRDLVDMEGEPSAMPFIDSLPKKQKGKVVVAGTGGGTNKSEYELLTSNSIQLMPGITPFNYLEFENSNSIVSHLEQLGYKTWGAHCAVPLNYSRGIVYPQLGFDKIMFSEDFGTISKYGKRSYATDEFCYGKMIEDYEKMGDDPRFMYLLTIQNHGGWDTNPDEEDIVKVSKDFGENTDDVAEFQSCISLSDKAFEELTDYFSKSERPVVICMVGDHAPSFARELVDNIDIEKTFALRTTPYVIWANFELQTDVPEITSMPYLAPITLEAAGCRQSPFYSYMNELKSDVPVITAFNLYKTVDNKLFKYSDESPYKEKVETYLELTYNNASPKAKRLQNLFMPWKADKTAEEGEKK